ncbi:MAG TPA: DUF3866 family protein [Firmicutes bacterium]|jgi:hypothetical protein|nr:DUF3866 family protein [Bacillota bacterium]HHT42847.1 DUF3866 family protein [Bacillota bacterium]
MECSTRWGVVARVSSLPGRQELLVRVGADEIKAICYPELTGHCQPGDGVLLNTTAVDLNLGTGGWHYVLAIEGRERSLASAPGHIIKLRYTPLQGRVLAVEEEESPHHKIMSQADSLEGLMVAVGSLHSMLAPLSWIIHRRCPGKRLVYLMSDGAALPLAFSQTVSLLKGRGMLAATITFGHAFGGDLEAVNIYSALLAAKYAADADLAVVLMGPGVVGTKTTWGTTALEQGIFLNAVLHLEGTPVAIPRMSLADSRSRHRGLSHHTQTVLGRIVQEPVFLPLPCCFRQFPHWEDQIGDLPHRISWEDTEEEFQHLMEADLPLSTMGRGPQEDPWFFHGVTAAALFLSRLADRGS